MKYLRTELVCNLEESDKEYIVEMMIDLGYSQEAMEEVMRGRICDVEDNIEIYFLVNESRVFVDEQGNQITSEELYKEYQLLVNDGETESETFADYLENCISKNGTLTEVTK